MTPEEYLRARGWKQWPVEVPTLGVSSFMWQDPVTEKEYPPDDEDEATRIQVQRDEDCKAFQAAEMAKVEGDETRCPTLNSFNERCVCQGGHGGNHRSLADDGEWRSWNAGGYVQFD